MLSFVTSKDKEVFIHADADGLELLKREIERLQKCLAEKKSEDTHLFSSSWGGNDLAEAMLKSESDKGCSTVHHVKLYSWTQEWAEKYGLEEGI